MHEDTQGTLNPIDILRIDETVVEIYDTQVSSKIMNHKKKEQETAAHLIHHPKSIYLIVHTISKHTFLPSPSIAN